MVFMFGTIGLNDNELSSNKMTNSLSRTVSPFSRAKLNISLIKIGISTSNGLKSFDGLKNNPCSPHSLIKLLKLHLLTIIPRLVFLNAFQSIFSKSLSKVSLAPIAKSKLSLGLQHATLVLTSLSLQ